MKKNNGWTTIALRDDTHKVITDRGKKGECYDDVIRREIGMPPFQKKETVIIPGDVIY